MSNAFFAWVVYVLCDIPIYLFAALSFDINVTTPPTGGYNLAYPSIFITNILRDIGMTAGLLNLFLILFAAFQIRHGQAIFRKKISRNPVTITLIIAFIFISSAFDIEQVTIITPATVVISASFTGVSLITLIIIISSYFYSAIEFRKAVYEGIKEADRPLKRRLALLSIGVVLMGVGNIYWLGLGILLYSPIGPFITENMLILSIFGHLIWASSPLLMYASLRQMKSKEV